MNTTPAPAPDSAIPDPSLPGIPTDTSNTLQPPNHSWPNPKEVFCTEEGHYPDAELPSNHRVPLIGDASYDVC